MTKLPDLEGLAIFAKVAELRSFAAAAAELQLSKATVSKAVGRLEDRLGTRLFNRTSRRLALTNAGQQLVSRAAQILADGEAAESEALAQSATPRGVVRLAAPMSFGLLRVAPLLPDFLAAYPEITVDLHLSDQMIDIVGEGFDAALRIGSLPDSSLIAQKLCNVPLLLVAAPSYFTRHERPTHPLHLAEHNCFTYFLAGDTWRFTNGKGETASVKPRGNLSADNGDAFLPSLTAGLGIARLPDFLVREALGEKKLESVLPDWSSPPGALHWVTPPGGPRPARVDALARFFAERLALR
ncbi:MAG TPA: LysR family transcriptional regulator [Rhizomicrobium sp.]|nr:LysR family transcriptional regulator [Rhizomicrobium sp.]